VELDKSTMLGVTVLGGIVTAVLLLIQMAATPAGADTMEAALLRAYQGPSAAQCATCLGARHR